MQEEASGGATGNNMTGTEVQKSMEGSHQAGVQVGKRCFDNEILVQTI